MSTSTYTRPPFSVSTLSQQGSRALALIVLYSMVLAACRYFAYEIRFDFLVPPEFQQERLFSLAVNLPIKLGFLLLFRQFGSLLTYFSVPDLLRIAVAMAAANLSSYLLRYGFNPGLLTPRGVVLMDFVLSVGALSSMRLGFRIYRERYLTGHKADGKKTRRIAVLGAGDAGAEFVREVQAKPSLGLKPIFFLDDDWKKHGHDIHGISVMGAPEDIGRLRKENLIDACVLAMPSAPGKRLQEIYKLISAEGLKVEIVPSMAELASGRVQVTKIRPVELEDLGAQVNAIAFTKDGKTLAVGTEDGKISLCSRETQEVIAVLTGHKGAVTSLAFSRDDNLLVSGSVDKTVRFWRAAPFTRTAAPLRVDWYKSLKH